MSTFLSSQTYVRFAHYSFLSKVYHLKGVLTQNVHEPGSLLDIMHGKSLPPSRPPSNTNQSAFPVELHFSYRSPSRMTRGKCPLVAEPVAKFNGGKQDEKLDGDLEPAFNSV